MRVISEKRKMTIEFTFDEAEEIHERFVVLDDFTIEDETIVGNKLIKAILVKEVLE